MSIFWLIAIAMTGLALVLLVRPFIRRREKIEALYAEGGDGALYRNQLEELAREAEAGTVPPEEAEALRAEIARRLLAAEAVSEKPRFHFDPLRTAGVIVLSVTIGAVILYALQGSPLLPSQPYRAASAQRDPGGEIAHLVAKLKAELKENPDNLEGWTRLGQAHQFLARYDEAADAYAQAISLAGTERPDLLSLYAQNLVLSEKGKVTPAARRAFVSVLDYDPKDVAARYYIGLADAQDGDTEAALGRWRELARDLPQDHPLAAPLGTQIRMLEENPAQPAPE
ncbi:MAG: c-type cytochrome biogenesis protein CcmI [Pseudomonadota bacterium]